MASTRKSSRKPEQKKHSHPTFRSREERLNDGKQLRSQIPREAHAKWQAPGRQRDVVAILEQSNRDRLQELVPIRYGRMLRSPFTFLRGSAALMAHDLSKGPNIGVTVQACGDAGHLAPEDQPGRIADALVELKAVCHCGRKATMNLRVDESGAAVRQGQQTEIGGNDRYVALCRKHFSEALAG